MRDVILAAAGAAADGTVVPDLESAQAADAAQLEGAMMKSVMECDETYSVRSPLITRRPIGR